MKVLVFNQYFTTPKGSYGTRVYEFARRWVEAGDQVTVVTSVYDMSDLRAQKTIEHSVIEGVDLRILNIRLSNKHGFLTRVATFIAYALMACWYALTEPCDVVVSSSGPITTAIPGLLARYVRRKPLVFEVRDLWPEGAIQHGILRNPILIWMSRLLEKTCYRAAHRTVALSDGMRDWIQATYGTKNVAVVPNASDNILAERARATDRPFVPFRTHHALYTGALGANNHCEQIIVVADELRKRGANDIEIVIVGDGKQRGVLEGMVRDRGLENVRFLGQMARQDVFTVLQGSCCSLMVSKDLAFTDTCSPNKMFDSFAAGVPFVQDTQGWIKRLLETENAGVTVTRNAPDQMAAAICDLAYNPAKRALMGENGRRLARERFDRSLLARTMREIVHSVAQGGVAMPVQSRGHAASVKR